MKNFSLLLALALSSPAAFSQTFKLYSEPHHQVDASCDVYTRLELTSANGVATAKLSEHLEGMCEIVPPAENPRSYTLQGKDDGCGSMVYANGAAGVQLVDNRSRMCENVIAALIEWTEQGQAFYSADF